MKEQHFLASANTTNGFTNYFDNINNDGFTYILKGGPGTGKSTFMKTIGSYFRKHGYNIEYFYCSSDPNSLDGVKIVEKKIAIVDGTAPHVTEATMPAIKEKIINVGDCINKNIKINQSKVQTLLDQKGICYKQCYNYLKSIAPLLEIDLLEKDNDEINKTTMEIIKSLNIKSNKATISPRTLFLSFIDKDGLCTIKDKNVYKKIISLNCKKYIDGFFVLKNLSNVLIKKNVPHTLFYSPLKENLIEGILIEKGNILLFNNLSNNNQSSNWAIENYLLKRGGKCIDKARHYHKQVEKIYIKYMDFDKLSDILSKTIKEIETNF